MPFEQRTSTYFVCGHCKDEYPITGNVAYSEIYRCAKKGCQYQETFLGLKSVSNSMSTDTTEGLFRRLWRNNIVQGIIVAVIMVLILGLVTWFVSNSVIGDLKEELQEIRNLISPNAGDR